MNRPELEWLGFQAAGLQQGAVWLEIGTLVGRSLLVTALSLPSNSTLVSIDKTSWTLERGGVRLEHTVPRIAALRPDIRLVMVRADSADAIRMLKLEPDVAFVDAGHQYETTAREIRDCVDILKPGGMICGHDYNAKDWPGVVQAVDELVPGFEVVPGGTIWFASVLKVRI